MIHRISQGAYAVLAVLAFACVRDPGTFLTLRQPNARAASLECVEAFLARQPRLEHSGPYAFEDAMGYSVTLPDSVPGWGRVAGHLGVTGAADNSYLVFSTVRVGIGRPDSVELAVEMAARRHLQEVARACGLAGAALPTCEYVAGGERVACPSLRRD